MKWLVSLMITFCVPVHSKVLLFDRLSSQPIHIHVQEVVEQAYTDLGYKVEYKYHPLKRSYVEAKAGRLSGLMGRVEQVEPLPNLVKIPVVLAEFQIVFVINTAICERCAIDNIDSIASVSGFVGLKKALEANHPHIDLFEVADRKTLFKMFERERIKVIAVSDVLINQELLNANPHWQVLPIAKEQLFHYIHKRHEEIVPELTITLEHIVQSKKFSYLSMSY